jgi:hypothetical protein
VHHLAVGLAVGQHDLLRIDDDDVVTGIDVGGEDRLVLATQDAGDLGAQTTEHHALGVDDVPGAGDLTCFRAVRAHLESFDTGG